MPNVVSTHLSITGEPAMLDEIKTNLDAAIEEHDSAFGYFYLMFTNLGPDYQWNEDKWSKWLGMDADDKPKIKEGVLTLSGQTAWVMPFAFCEWLSQKYPVKVEVSCCVQHNHYWVGWYANGECYVQNEWVQDMGEPVRDWRVRDGVDYHKPDVNEGATPRAVEEFKRRPRNIDALVSPELFAALPDAPPEWFAGATAPVDDVLIQAGLYGDHDDGSALDSLVKIAEREQKLRSEGKYSEEEIADVVAYWNKEMKQQAGLAGHAYLEYYVIAKRDDNLIAVRQWVCNGRIPTLELLRPGDLLDAHPTVARDTNWVPQTVGSLMQVWKNQGFFEGHRTDPSYVPGTVSVDYHLRARPAVNEHEEEFWKELNEITDAEQ